MKNCRWEHRVEQWFDGMTAKPGGIEQHVTQCASCRAHLEGLETLRGAARGIAEHQHIADAQFPVFMEGVRGGIEPAAKRHGGLWALASMAAAAVIVAASAFVIFTNGPREVKAQTIVESYSSDLEAATITSYSSEDGTITVWLNIDEGDVW